jgi:hypothetical protein
MQMMHNRWQILGTTIGYAVLALLCLFVLFHFRIWWQGPQILIQTPLPGAESPSSVIRVRGNVYNLARLYVNGMLIPTSLADNTFITEVSLPLGYSSIGLDGYTRSGHHIHQDLPITYRGLPLVPETSRFLVPENTSAVLDIIEQSRASKH